MARAKQKPAREARKPLVTMWRGLGTISPKGIYLEAYGALSDYAIQKYRLSPAGSRLVMVTARLEEVTPEQVDEAGDLQMGFVRSGKVGCPWPRNG
jgi:hypothetical protein